MARIGSVAAAPFLGDQFASLYLGATRVPTVPGSVVFYNSLFIGGNQEVEFTGPANNGGSAVVSLVYKFNGSTITPNITNYSAPLNRYFAIFTGTDLRGLQVSAAAVNAVGQGMSSAPETVI
jgi:hypothetical protein